MATSPQQDQQNPQNQQHGSQSGGAPGSEQRSEGLLPAGQDDGDGRFEVAEEVNLDQQSDALRHVGQLPDDQATDDQLPDPGQQADG